MSSIKQSLKVYWKINWLRRSIKTVAAIALVLSALPLIIQLLAEHQLKKMGAHEASIEDIDLNLFAGSFQINQLAYTRGNEQPAELKHLALDLDMLALFSGVIQVNYLRITGLHNEIVRHKSGDIAINGLSVININQPSQAASDAPSSDAEPLKFTVNEVVISDSTITYKETDLAQRLEIGRLSARAINSWQLDKPALIDAEMALNDAKIVLHSEALLFSIPRKFHGRLEVASLRVQDYAKFYREHLEQLQAKIDIDVDFEVEMGDALVAQLESSVEIADLSADYQHIHQSLERLKWRGKTRLSGDGGIVVAGDLSVIGNRTVDRREQYDIAVFDSLALSGLSHQASATRIEELTLDKLSVVSDAAIQPESHKRFASIDKVSINRLAFAPSAATLVIDLIELHAPGASVVLDKNRQLLHLDPLMKTIDGFSSTADTAADSDQPVAGDKPPFAFTIKQLRLLTPGVIDIEDSAVSPVYKTRLHLNQIDIDNLSSTDSASFKLALKQGDYTAIDIDGEGLLLDPLQAMQLDARITQLDLPPVTPYTSNAMGYGMKSGTVDTELKVKLDKHDIDSLIDLKIDSIEVVETHGETAEQITSASGMSIDLAVSSLKDSDNVIELKIPVKGNVDSPDFDLSHVINNAMGKAMKAATLSYLKYSLQPFGSLITLFNLAQSAVNHIALPPVIFKVNSAEFDAQQDDLLNKVVKVLQDRPGLKIKACGVATDADRAAIEAELRQIEIARIEQAKKNTPASKEPGKPESDKPPVIEIAAEVITHKARELADTRSARVKQIILDQGQLDSSRILNCLSSLKTGQDASPSVELSI